MATGLYMTKCFFLGRLLLQLLHRRHLVRHRAQGFRAHLLQGEGWGGCLAVRQVPLKRHLLTAAKDLEQMAKL